MDDETIRLNIRSALQGLIDKEKGNLHSIYDKSDSDHRARVEKLRPVFNALSVLKEEIGDIATISIAPAGHTATVEIKSGASSNRMSISTNYGSDANGHFTVEHNEYFSWTSDYSEKTHHLDSGDEVLQFVMAEVSKAIASRQVLAERKK
jgi:hypothetical protein